MKLRAQGRNGLIAELTYQDVQVLAEALGYYASRQREGRLWAMEGAQHLRRLLDDFLYRHSRLKRSVPLHQAHPVYSYRAPLFPSDDPSEEFLFGDRSRKWGLVPEKED